MLGRVLRPAIDVAGRPVDAVVSRPPHDVLMLIYHRVGRRSSSPVDLDQHEFGRQLDVLAASGRVVSLDTAVTMLTESDHRVSVTEPAVVITVDDGTGDWPDLVMPALVDRDLPGTFYVATDFVERQRPFPDGGAPVSWDGLADMLSTGLATIGSHTHTHRVMHDVSAGESKEEVDRSVELIENRLGVTPRHFAYPKAVAPSPAAETVVRRRFDSATLAGNRGSRRGADVHRLGRHALTAADTLSSFQRKVGGGMLLEGWLRERRDAWQVSRAGRP